MAASGVDVAVDVATDVATDVAVDVAGGDTVQEPFDGFVSAAVSADGTELTITHDRTLARLFFDWESFALSGTGAQPRWVRMSGADVILELDRPVLASETVTVSYTQPADYRIVDTNGDYQSDYAANAVTNNSTIQSPGEILDTAFVDAWDEASMVAGNAFPVTAWTGTTYDFSISGTVTGRTLAAFGPKGIRSARFQSGGIAYSDAAGLGDLVSGASVGAFAFGQAFCMADASDAQELPIWQDTGGSARVALVTASGEWDLVLTNDAGTDTTINLGETVDLREHYVVISYAGSGGALRVDWDGQTIVDQGSTSQSGTSTVDRFAIGGGTDMRVREAFVGDAALSAGDFTALNAYLAGAYDNPRTQQYTTRYELFTPGGGYGNHPHLMAKPSYADASLTGDFLMYFSGHTGAVQRLAHSASITSGWTVLGTGGTDWSYANLLTARGEAGGGGITAPSVWDAGSELRGVGKHYIGSAHNEHAVRSSDCLAFTFEDSGADIGAEPDTYSSYFRPFQVGGVWFAVANGGSLQRCTTADGLGPYELPADEDVFKGVVTAGGRAIRHAGCRVNGTTLEVYFTRSGEHGERILKSDVDISGGAAAWESWAMQTPTEVIEPRDGVAWETGTSPYVISQLGAAGTDERCFRDPMIYVHTDDTQYLAYSVSEETIAVTPLVEAWYDALPSGAADVFEGEAPSVLTPVTSFPGDVSTWAGSLGLLTATVAAAQNPSYPAAVQAGGFDGVHFDSDDRVNVALAIGDADSYALYFAIRPEDITSAVCTIAAANDGASDRVLVSILTTGQLRHMRSIGAGNYIHAYGGSTLSDDTLYVVQVAYHSGTSYLRVSGDTEESAAHTQGSFSATHLSLGDRFSPTQVLDGAIYAAVPFVNGSVPSSASLRAQAFEAVCARFGVTP